MQKLTQRTQELISRGFNTCGKSHDAFFYIEEELYVSEVKHVQNFINWIVDNNKMYGRVNAQERFAEWKVLQ